MAGENADVLRSSQIGIENIAGTAVAANVILPATSITPKPVHASELLYRRGDKITVGQVSVKGSHTTAAVSGFAAFNDLLYLYSMACKAATVTTPVGGTLTRDHSWTLLSNVAEMPKTVTVEDGLAGVDAARFAHGNLVSLGLDFDRERAVNVTGDMLGTLLAEEGVTLTTAGVTELPLVPVSPDIFDVFAADTLAGLSGGQLNSCYRTDWRLGDRRSPVFPFRSDKRSYSGLVEKRNTLAVHLEVEKDAQCDLIMRQLRQSRTRYVRLFAQGPEIESGFRYELELIMAYKATNPDRGAIDEVYGGMYDLVAVKDATLGGFAKIRLRCPLAGLIAATNLAAGQQTGALIEAVAPSTGVY